MKERLTYKNMQFSISKQNCYLIKTIYLFGFVSQQTENPKSWMTTVTEVVKPAQVADQKRVTAEQAAKLRLTRRRLTRQLMKTVIQARPVGKPSRKRQETP